MVWRLFALAFLAASLSACASKQTYLADCQTATFTATQCGFLYSKRDIRIGVSGPIIGGIVGINLP